MKMFINTLSQIEDIEKKVLPKNYLDAKEENERSIPLFCVGDFYVTYGKDAEIISEILGVSLEETSSGRCAFFPVNQFYKNISTLIKNGFSVVLYENENYTIGRMFSSTLELVKEWLKAIKFLYNGIKSITFAASK